MLHQLHISQLAVIDDAKIDLDNGLVCFTGATGAGKSLLIGAIEILLGFRGASDMVRPGATEARVSGVFDCRSPSTLALIGQIIDARLDSTELLLVRRIFANGRSTASINGQPITLAMLKQIGEFLVDVHGQHDHQFLLRPSNQLDTLDEFANSLTLRTRYHDVWTNLQQSQRDLAERSAHRKARVERLELLRFQLDEIDQARLDPAEHAKLESRQNVLANLERLRTESGGLYSLLYDSEDAIIDRLKPRASELAELAKLDPQLQGVSEQVRQALILLEEAAFDLNRYAQKLDLDPQELGEVVARLNTINRLLKKYGGSVDDVLRLRDTIATEIEQLSRTNQDESQLTQTIAKLQGQLTRLGNELSELRKSAGGKLSKKVESQLAELGMENAKFTVELATLEEPGPGGFDACEFMVQTNPGLASAPLRKIASGGEIGRIMLAIKSTLAAGDRVSVLVFDEIDANIGGRLGSVIGSKLRSLARHHQVLCITHLPQIAAFGQQHFSVCKEQTGKATFSRVRVLEGSERVEELAEMIGGTKITATTRAQARELLACAQEKQNVALTVTKSRADQSTAEKPNLVDPTPRPMTEAKA